MSEMNSNIKAVGFDLGGVVAGTAVPQLLERAPKALGVELQQFMDAMELYRPQYERGEITTEQFWQGLTAKLGIAYKSERDLKVWVDGFVESSPVRQEMLDLADRLQANGYKVGMFSNTNEQHVAMNKTRGIFEHFPVCLMSNEEGVCKPEPRSYQLLAEKLGVEPTELVFIDDLEENVAGANTLGIHGIKYSGYHALLKDLQSLGINTD